MKPATIGLIGNPNCGKTTLFNQLTGARQKVGNWPGVTVEKKEGAISIQQQRHILVDLPGTYALDSNDHELSLDERIAREFVLSQESDLVINIVDGSNLERNLYLSSQLLDMGVPMIIAVNMLDVAEREGLHIDTTKMSKLLGVPVVPIVAAQGEGIDELRQVISNTLQHATAPTPVWQASGLLQQALNELSALIPNDDSPRWHAVSALESQEYGNADLHQAGEQWRLTLEAEYEQPIDVILANSRYQTLQGITRQISHRTEHKKTITEKIDSIVINRYIGIPFFFAVMYLMFTFAINIGGAFIDFFDIASAAIFVDGFRYLLEAISLPAWLVTLLADGFGGGIQLVATFIPIIGGLYLFLSIIEDSGYMARAAFVMDRLMRAVGLPGKSFVPLIVGFGCNVPSVMAARTMDTHKDRLLTIAMAPFMSCGARLSVFALFAAAFFSDSGATMVFSLYVLGIAMALLTGLALKHTLFKPELTPFVMELPAYHIPTVRGVLLKTWERLRSFIRRAGKTIIMVVTILSFLNSIGTDGSFGNENNEKSVLSEIARVATPVLAPLGVKEDNWPATVGIITGIFAKEAVVGTLDALYNPEDAEAGDEYDLWGSLQEAVLTIPANLVDVSNNLLDPLGLGLVGADQTVEQGVHNGTFTAMEQLFGSQLAAFSYLVFVLLYTPCVATLGAMVREAGMRWMLFVAGWSTGLAYTTAVIVYQIGSLGVHPVSSVIWVLACGFFIGGCLWQIRRHAQKRDAALIPLTSVG